MKAKEPAMQSTVSRMMFIKKKRMPVGSDRRTLDKNHKKNDGRAEIFFFCRDGERLRSISRRGGGDGDRLRSHRRSGGGGDHRHDRAVRRVAYVPRLGRARDYEREVAQSANRRR